MLSVPVVLAVCVLELRGIGPALTGSSLVGPAIFGTVSAAGFCAVAVTLLRQGSTANGWTSFLGAVAMIPESFVEAGLWGWPFFIGGALLACQLVPTVALLLRYPSDRLNRANRILVAFVAMAAIGLPLVNEMRGLGDARGAARAAVAVVLAVVCVAALLRLQSSAGIARRGRVPLVAIALLVAPAGAAELVAELAVNPVVFSLVPLPLAHDLRVAVTSLVPLAVAGDLLSRRAARAALGRSVLSSFRERDPDRLRQALRHCLADPRLEVWVPGPDAGTWLDLDGRPTDGVAGSADGGRHQWAARDGDGSTLALIDVDERTVRDDPDLLVSALNTARVGLENARLDAQLTAQILELDASRSRILAAAENERREIQRELMAGPRAELSAAEAALAAVCGPQGASAGASNGKAEPAARTSIKVARAHIQTALNDLRELARGVYPALLSQGGLGPALRALPEQTDLPLNLSINETSRDLRLRPAVEYTAYFAVIESIVRAAESKASRIIVNVSVGSERVDILTGITAPSALDPTSNCPSAEYAEYEGPGLSHLVRDRILALGGSCDLIQPDGDGQAGVHVTIPVIP